VADDVDAEPSDAAHAGVRGAVELPPAEDRANAAEQLDLGEGLGDVVVGPDLQAEDAVGLGVASSSPCLGLRPRAIDRLERLPLTELELSYHVVDRPVRAQMQNYVASGRDRRSRRTRCGVTSVPSPKLVNEL
jgi:hypothetical protein